MTLPTFIVIGAGRSGTTSLYHYLRQHPEIAMSAIKETRYFGWEAEEPGTRAAPDATVRRFYPVRSLHAYRAQFAHARGRRASGEATPLYLFMPGVPERIAALLPEVRLVAILREPGRRAYAQYMACRRIGWDRRSFAQAVEEEIATLDEPIRPASRRYYLDQGLYAAHLGRFIRRFGRERLLVLLSDDLAAAPEATMRSLLRFIDVDDAVPLDLTGRFGPAGLARRAWQERLMTNPLTGILERVLPSVAVAAAHRLTKPPARRQHRPPADATRSPPPAGRLLPRRHPTAGSADRAGPVGMARARPGHYRPRKQFTHLAAGK